ncbi:MFS transporter [Gemmata sp. JC717]|uniref:MFS transporter n=1 Tax=Gemmata algarum TaxID=2975278 RepID=UPI0021BA8988|nr:MFS transporter [Gemmata algarum]MDY3551576.1 MFS transporter [Gemmata algarum]
MSATPPAAPTTVRYRMLFLLCLLAMITYLDRAMYGSAKGDLMAAVGQPEKRFYLVLVAFQIAYALFEIPAGWMGDRFGPRITLLRVVAWFSLFVGLTAFAGYALPGTEIVVIGFGVLVAMQFLFGIGEAGAFPNISKAIYNWFPEDKRGSAKGLVWMSARLMGGLTPFVWVLLVVIGGLTWRQALGVFAAVAALWCVAFYATFRNRPAEHPDVNAAEDELINAGKGATQANEAVPWGRIFTNRNVLALCAMYTVTNFNWYFLMYYLPKTLKDQFPSGNATDGGKLLLALLGGAPLLVGMAGCLLGGLLTDRYIRRTGDRKWGRRIYGMLGYGLAGCCYAAAAAFTGGNLWVFAGCLILAGFTNDLIMGPSWATAQDIGRRYSAIVSGAMNMVGNLGAALGNLITGLILETYTVKQVVDGKEVDVVSGTGYVTCFTMYAVVYGLGVLTWLVIDPTKPVVEEIVAPEPESEEAR